MSIIKQDYGELSNGIATLLDVIDPNTITFVKNTATGDSTLSIPSSELKSFIWICTYSSYKHAFIYDKDKNKLYWDNTGTTGMTELSNSLVSYSDGYIRLNISTTLGGVWEGYTMLIG